MSTPPTYVPTSGGNAWSVLAIFDSRMAALDAAPWQRNAFAGDQWSRTKGILEPTTATPRGHLEYAVAVQNLQPTGNTTTDYREMEATIQVAFGFLAFHDDQWQSHLFAMQADQQVRRALMDETIWCGELGATRLMDNDSAFQATTLPTGEAGLLITQTYRVRFHEGLT